MINMVFLHQSSLIGIVQHLGKSVSFQHISMRTLKCIRDAEVHLLTYVLTFIYHIPKVMFDLFLSILFSTTQVLPDFIASCDFFEMILPNCVFND